MSDSQDPDTTGIDQEAIGPVLGRVPSGIFILTVRHGEGETGMLASWVMQAGFEPPSVTVAVRGDRYVANWLGAEAPFALNLVSEGGKGLLAHFGRGFEPDQPAFEGLDVTHGTFDLPLLTSGTLGHLICRPTTSMTSGDHRVFLADIVEGQLRSEDAPMLHVRKSGLHY
ncbi:MAG: flavin reductase [Planctomycetota bacterium]|nr:MAG: flavin reductase [Planctomycetota bacterium]REJ91202.1 MAG: flavin reductase [Planctomycetota bacterium]REK22203.1 MAG: flavin reductase [Planctomycetota bacterium]REK44275.1 MAG: flavin reductase [Planctomycetota bacterium]